MGILKRKHLEEMEEEASIEEEAEEIFLDTIVDKEPEEDFDEEEDMIEADEQAYEEALIDADIEEALIDADIARQEKIHELVEQKLSNLYEK